MTYRGFVHLGDLKQCATVKPTCEILARCCSTHATKFQCYSALTPSSAEGCGSRYSVRAGISEIPVSHNLHWILWRDMDCQCNIDGGKIFVQFVKEKMQKTWGGQLRMD